MVLKNTKAMPQKPIDRPFKSLGPAKFIEELLLEFENICARQNYKIYFNKKIITIPLFKFLETIRFKEQIPSGNIEIKTKLKTKLFSLFIQKFELAVSQLNTFTVKVWRLSC